MSGKNPSVQVHIKNDSNDPWHLFACLSVSLDKHIYVPCSRDKTTIPWTQDRVGNYYRNSVAARGIFASLGCKYLAPNFKPPIDTSTPSSIGISFIWRTPRKRVNNNAWYVAPTIYMQGNPSPSPSTCHIGWPSESVDTSGPRFQAIQSFSAVIALGGHTGVDR